MNDHSSMSAADLLARMSSQGREATDDELSKATSILKARGLHALSDLCLSDLRELGIEDEELAGRVLAAFELGRRAGNSNKGQRQQLSRSTEFVRHFEHLRHENQEHFCAMYLDAKLGILGTKTVHIGSLTMSLVSSRDIFREALRVGASAVIVVHNHPSGDPTPSPEDIATTQKLVEAGRLLEIDVIDHLIIGHHDYFSFAEKKLL